MESFFIPPKKLKKRKTKRIFFQFSRIFQEVENSIFSLPEICDKIEKNSFFLFSVFWGEEGGDKKKQFPHS
jgi:hypothetical protein